MIAPSPVVRYFRAGSPRQSWHIVDDWQSDPATWQYRALCGYAPDARETPVMTRRNRRLYDALCRSCVAARDRA